MSAETHHYLQLLEKRIGLMQSLANSLAIANSSLLTFDLDSLESAINRQEELSLAVRALDAEITHVQAKCAHVLPPRAGAEKSSAAECANDSFRGAIERLARVQETVRTLNDTHLALLRKSRRTVHALLNSYQSFVSLYSNPHSNLPADRALAAERI